MKDTVTVPTFSKKWQFGGEKIEKVLILNLCSGNRNVMRIRNVVDATHELETQALQTIHKCVEQHMRVSSAEQEGKGCVGGV